MTPPNYFRWVKTGDTVSGYDGYTLTLTDDFEGSDWGTKNTGVTYATANTAGNIHTDDFDGTAWSLNTTGVTYATANAAGNIHTEDFNATSGTDWPDDTP